MFIKFPPAARALMAGLALGCASSCAPAAPPANVGALAHPAVQSATSLSAAMLAVTRAGSRLVAVGERGVVLLSDDNGGSWRQARTPVRASLTAVQFVDDQLGWAVGHLGVILHTSDGGQTWVRQLDGVQTAALFTQAAEVIVPPASAEPARAYARLLTQDGPDKPFLGLRFSDAKNGIVVGAYNLALVTHDGGSSWQPLSQILPNPRSLHLYGISKVDNTIVIVGEQGLILRSDDGGHSFSALPSPYKGSWFGVMSARDGAWIVYGLRGSAYRSTDRGSSWEQAQTGVPASLTSGLLLHDGSLLLVTQTGDLLYSTNGGRSFEPRSAAAPTAIADVAQAADGSLTFATLRGPMRDPTRGAASR
ncbi:WD40/YVTN/BNR-like repeat-containing protein [Methylibium sp.]|uniref:WD40/YVTN/BNR-like repeat-containing protein n=1 Tax=Methylibium sp. TaxID=2067992 RepID=UPI003D0B670E